MNKAYWSPYLVGAGIGILSWVVFVVVNNPLGISTAVSEASGAALMPLIGNAAVTANPYWAKTVPQWDYATLFLVGTFLGALVSAVSAKTFRWEVVPEVWQERYGGGSGKRLLVAFLGGAIILYGARMAGGCTSGHGISGSLQLALSSWIFFIVMFISGLITARIIFKTNPTK